MQAHDRLVTHSTRPMAFGILVAVMLAVALFAVALFASGLHGTQPSTTIGAQVATQHQQAPDAQDRNDSYSAALAARAHVSADGADRNAQLTYLQVVAKFNNQSPDAQERNIQLSTR